MNLSSQIAKFSRRLVSRPRMGTTTFLGHDLVIREGIIREPPDYDEAWFYACAQRAAVVLDVGANQGQAALIALLCPNVRETTLIEANPEALVVAAETLVRNHLSERARFICAFASNVARSTMKLWTINAGAAGSMYAGHAKTAALAGASMEVPTVTLDDVVTSFGIEPDLIKIDVEGAEGLVLDGARKCAGAKRATFLVEMHSNPELTMTANVAQVLQWCRELGYEAWYLAQGVRLDGPAPVAHRGRCHLLLLPAGRPYPSWLVGIRQQAPLSAAQSH